MVKKIRDILYELCNYLELIMAIVVVAGIVIAALGLREEFLCSGHREGIPDHFMYSSMQSLKLSSVLSS